MKADKINFINNYTLLVISGKGKMVQLFAPFPVEVMKSTGYFKQKSRVFVDEVKQHPNHVLLYRVIDKWWPYHIFKIEVRF